MKPLVLLSDFGHSDHYVGVLHSVLAASAPASPRVDLCHEVPAGDVWGAAFRLRSAWPWLPLDTVVLVVVDPGVGGSRRAAAVRIGERWVVGPDNGVLCVGGAADEAWELQPATLGARRLSSTFHGRDLFAPAAARLARGAGGEALGIAIDPAVVEPCPLPEPRRSERFIDGVVLHTDRFGNVVTNVPADWVREGARLECAGVLVTRLVSRYGEGARGELVMLAGSSGLLELAVDRASAAGRLGAARGEQVVVRW